MFKSGDRIRIKSWDKMVEEYGKLIDCDDIPFKNYSYFFCNDMKYLCEQEGFVIKNNEEDDCIEIKLDNYGEITEWYITEEMIELI